MGVFVEYSLPVQGLKNGIHKFKYLLDGSFFQHFESSPIGESEIVADLTLDIRSDMMVLDFELSGWMRSVCDRCSADIQLPLGSEQILYVKYSEEKEEDDDEVVFISREAASFNVAKYLYEFAVLSLPFTNTYDCESDAEPPCNLDVLQYLNGSHEDNNNDDEPGSSVWDALKDLK